MRIVHAAIVAAGLSLVPSFAAAQPANVATYCFREGPATNCFDFGFSVSVGAIDFGGVGGQADLVTFWFRNLQGTRTPDATPFSIDNWWIGRTVEDGDELYVDGDNDACGVTGDAVAGEACWVPSRNQIGTEVDFYVEGSGGVFGCAGIPPADDGTFYVAATCGAGGYDGWSTYWRYMGVYGIEAGEMRSLALDEIVIEVEGCTVHDRATPITGGCLVATQVVPEPASVLLLGGGLLALGGVGVVRRR